jgi:hypothetical protein
MATEIIYTMTNSLKAYGDLIVRPRISYPDPEEERFDNDILKALKNAQLRIEQLERVIATKRTYEEQWDDLRVPASSVKILGSANIPYWDTFIGVTQILRFDASDQVFFNLQLPHGWKEGTAIKPHVHWSSESTDTGTDEVEWNLEYVIANVNGIFPSSSTTITGNKRLVWPVTHRTNSHEITPLPTIEMDDKLISCMMVARLYRGVDNYDHAPGLLEVDFHHLMDGNGSNNEFEKVDMIGPDEGVGKDW